MTNFSRQVQEQLGQEAIRLMRDQTHQHDAPARADQLESGTRYLLAAAILDPHEIPWDKIAAIQAVAMRPNSDPKKS